MTSTVQRFLELMCEIYFFTIFSVKWSEKAFCTEISSSMYDNLGKSLSKYESHPSITTVIPDFMHAMPPPPSSPMCCYLYYLSGPDFDHQGRLRSNPAAGFEIAYLIT